MSRKIAVVGTGAVGAYTGGHLVRTGQDVTFLDPWPEHVEYMKTNGLELFGVTEAERFTVPVRALHLSELESLSREAPFDIVFVCTKSYDTAWSTTMIAPFLAPDGFVVSLQNCINEETIAVYGLVNSAVLDDFPDLKIVVSHGGGAIPYQLGRFESGTLRREGAERFSRRLRRLYYDTVLYTPEAIELLIRVAGVNQCLFGAECPGVGSSINPDTGRHMDDVAHHIQGFAWLSDADREKILAGNARRVFKLAA